MADKSKDMTFGSEMKASIGAATMFVTEESLRCEYQWREPSESGMVGTDKPGNAGRQVVREDVRGDLVVQPSYPNIKAILGYWFDTGYVAADTPNSKTSAVVIDRGVDVYTYAACWLSQLELDWRAGEPVDCRLTLLGTTESNAGSVSTLAVPDCMLPSDLSISINSNAYFPESGRIRFNYDLTERFANSKTRTSIAARIPRVELELDFDLNADNWADLQALAGVDTKIPDVVLTWTDGTYTLTQTMEDMTNMNPTRWPDISGVEAAQHTVNLRAWLESGQSDIATWAFSS